MVEYPSGPHQSWLGGKPGAMLEEATLLPVNIHQIFSIASARPYIITSLHLYRADGKPSNRAVLSI